MLLEGELTALYIRPDDIPEGEVSGKDGLSEWVLELRLYGPLQGVGTCWSICPFA
jgi:hypothetical protein